MRTRTGASWHARRVTEVERQARRWTYARQRLGQAAPRAGSALRDVIGVYSSHPTAPLSLHARSRGFDARAFGSLDALRLPAMRGSIHLLPRETAHLAFRALPEPAARRAYRLKGFGLSDERCAELLSRVLAAAAAAGEPRTPRQLSEEVGEDVRAVIATATRDGSMVRVGAPGLRSNALRYAPLPVPEADADEALAWLVREYLRAFGPVRRQDAIWWTGTTAARIDRALAEIDTVKLDSDFLLLREDEPGFDRSAGAPAGVVDLLPKWDAYTMGYPSGGRGRFADPDVAERLYDFRGDGLPAILVDGAAAGTWALGKGSIEADWFEGPSRRVARSFSRAAESVLRLLS
jgi:hypothetical protein